VVARRLEAGRGRWCASGHLHDVVAWAALAELCGEHLTKGRVVSISGRLQSRTWEGRDGAKRRRVEVVASSLQALDRKPSPPDLA
jgi:single-strand DNA-binding protein